MKTKIIDEFRKYLPIDWEPTDNQVNDLEKLVEYANANAYVIEDDVESIFIEAVNCKLDLNREAYQHVLDSAYLEGMKLNYIFKTKIKKILDKCDYNEYLTLLHNAGMETEGMIKAFCPVSRDKTLNAVREIANNDSKYHEVYCSIFSRFCFNLFPAECTYSFFSGENNVDEDFYSYLFDKYPDLGNRDNALCLIDVSQDLFDLDYNQGCNKVLCAVKDAFYELNNHCDLAVYIPQIHIGEEDIQWRLYADVILFAEKHKKEKIDRAYFKWQKIGNQTLDYIKELSAYNAEFEYAFQGFVFKDCFVLGKDKRGYSLLLLFEKNVRDERIVNCPACRSDNVQGNSYPILNVKSWECENSLCPDRSKYNRGKRYAFMSLFRQREMMNDDNLIPEESIAKWHLDCVRNSSKKEALEMAIRHYSCVGDSIIYIGNGRWNQMNYNRTVVERNFRSPSTNLLEEFKKSTYFYRYLHVDDKTKDVFSEWTNRNAIVYCGDSLDVLRTIPDNSISGAVTSPPYYNAKSYSQWGNIYCYLYDMFNINREVYRVLKPGSVFLYNIFDYFDNENNVALSAMGNKRMILGAYMIDMFERIGFNVCGNIVWNKGEIQGNRSFNQGNMTPYYQAPLNCWEHILIVSKGKPAKKYNGLFSAIKDIRPVIKIIHGKNVLGHDAPYPYEIPELLIDCMDRYDTVIDPFLGSGTTCIVANRKQVHSIGIEKSQEYYELCQRLIAGDCFQTELAI